MWLCALGRRRWAGVPALATPFTALLATVAAGLPSSPWRSGRSVLWSPSLEVPAPAVRRRDRERCTLIVVVVDCRDGPSRTAALAWPIVIAWVVAVLGAASLTHAVRRRRPRRAGGVRRSMFGQGNATLIQHEGLHDPRRRRARPTPAGRAAAGCRCAAGRCARGDAHAQADHEGGAAAVLGAESHVPVGRCWTAQRGVQSADGDPLRRNSRRARRPDRRGDGGTAVRAGPIDVRCR